MNARRFALIALVMLVTIGITACTGPAEEAGQEQQGATGTEQDQPATTESAQELERTVELADLPPLVKQTILKEAGDHPLAELEEIRDGDELYYEAEWLEGGQEVEIRVSPDGELLGKWAEEPDDEDDEGEEDDEDENEHHHDDDGDEGQGG